MASLSLRDYGLIGNHDTTALVSRLGSVDWCCLPYLDSPSHFEALLDETHGGLFQISPREDFQSEQRYAARTCVLETAFETASGRGLVTDFMPLDSLSSPQPVIDRRVETLEGSIDWAAVCRPRFHYGAEPAQVERTYELELAHAALFRGSTPGDLATLRSSVPILLSGDLHGARATFRLRAGETARFVWSWGRQARESVSTLPTLEQTSIYWRGLAHDCKGGGCAFAGPWHENVVRSGIVLRMMVNRFAGSMAEAATTSLPALTGGTRNWDYRYAWLRESAMALQGLTALGYSDEASAIFRFMSDIVVRDGAEGLQAVYTLDGGRSMPERELPFLTGYAGARPVRVGNLSARNFHLDVFGHVILAAAQWVKLGKPLPEGLWNRLSELTEYVCQAWRRPDRGPWELRVKPEHFVLSKVLCWVALDQMCWLAEKLGHRVPARWLDERAILHRTICQQGYDRSRRSFVRAFGERELDASALLIPIVGFLPFEDERVQSTLDAVQTELADGVLVHRYRASEGVPESDGAHLLCSFWLVSCLALSGRVDEASDNLAELTTYATPLGFFAEQVDPVTGEPAGNLPSAAAHLALVNASLHVGQARNVGRRKAA